MGSGFSVRDLVRWLAGELGMCWG